MKNANVAQYAPQKNSNTVCKITQIILFFFALFPIKAGTWEQKLTNKTELLQ